MFWVFFKQKEQSWGLTDNSRSATLFLKQKKKIDLASCATYLPHSISSFCLAYRTDTTLPRKFHIIPVNITAFQTGQLDWSQSNLNILLKRLNGFQLMNTAFLRCNSIQVICFYLVN